MAAAAAALLTVVVLLLGRWRKQPVYLLDFECYRHPDASLFVGYKRFIRGSRLAGVSRAGRSGPLL